jgi:hypothetical protein
LFYARLQNRQRVHIATKASVVNLFESFWEGKKCLVDNSSVVGLQRVEVPDRIQQDNGSILGRDVRRNMLQKNMRLYFNKQLVKTISTCSLLAGLTPPHVEFNFIYA